VSKKGYDWENKLSFYPGETHIVLVDLKSKFKEGVTLKKFHIKN